MIQLTLGQAIPEIASVCGSAGMQVSNPLVIARINSAVQELMNEGEYPGVVDRYHIVSLSGEITLPAHLDRLMQVNIRGVPQAIASPWWQFVAYGPGTREDQTGLGQWWFDDTMISDRGEFPTRFDIPATDGPWRLRVYADVAEQASSCTIQGLNPDGEIVRTQVDGEWINGEQVLLSDGTGGGMHETTEYFASITVFTKIATNGYIRLTAWNGTTEVPLSNYQPDETDPSYHRYFSQFLSNLNAPDDSPLRVVRGRCRKRFKAVSENTDPLIITNLPALSEMVIAQWKRLSDNLESYAAHKATAVDLMRKEATAYRGKSRIPGLTFQRGFPVGSSLPALR